jgi:hypothetical protein
MSWIWEYLCVAADAETRTQAESSVGEAQVVPMPSHRAMPAGGHAPSRATVGAQWSDCRKMLSSADITKSRRGKRWSQPKQRHRRSRLHTTTQRFAVRCSVIQSADPNVVAVADGIRRHVRPGSIRAPSSVATLVVPGIRSLVCAFPAVHTAPDAPARRLSALAAVVLVEVHDHIA